jgi:hypothetical protein
VSAVPRNWTGIASLICALLAWGAAALGIGFLGASHGFTSGWNIDEDMVGAAMLSFPVARAIMSAGGGATARHNSSEKIRQGPPHMAMDGCGQPTGRIPPQRCAFHGVADRLGGHSQSPTYESN